VRQGLFKRGRRELISGTLLVVLAFRALVPAGFMPATDGSFSLQICHVGFSGALFAQLPGHHPGDSAKSDHCPFTAVPAAAPVPQLMPLVPVFVTALERMVRFEAHAVSVRAARAHQARAPPALI
jgi:hypothetical protein